MRFYSCDTFVYSLKCLNQIIIVYKLAKTHMSERLTYADDYMHDYVLYVCRRSIDILNISYDITS